MFSSVLTPTDLATPPASPANLRELRGMRALATDLGVAEHTFDPPASGEDELSVLLANVCASARAGA